MEGILDEEKDFAVASLCYRRSTNSEEFMNCATLFRFFRDNVTQEEFVRAVQTEAPTKPRRV